MDKGKLEQLRTVFKPILIDMIENVLNYEELLNHFDSKRIKDIWKLEKDSLVDKRIKELLYEVKIRIND